MEGKKRNMIYMNKSAMDISWRKAYQKKERKKTHASAHVLFISTKLAVMASKDSLSLKMQYI